jgi:hypothetical protein
VLSIVAIGLAAVSLVVAIHAELRAARQERRQIDVGCWRIPARIDGGMPMIGVRAVNRGHRPVELSFYFWGSGPPLVTPPMFGDRLPKLLNDGESFNTATDEFKVDEAATAAEARVTHVAVSDAEGNEYSAPYPPIDSEPA